MNDLRFYLGTHRPQWLWEITDTPLFVSHRRLCDRVSEYPKATTPWALDSGGFTELNLFGGWRTTPHEYVEAVHRYSEELGSLEWASPQDWMVEPWMLEHTGLTIREHQDRTIDNFLLLRDLAPTLPFIPVLQGWEADDYLSHAEQYAAAGVDLTTEPVVGVGSVCRRQHTGQIAGVFDALSPLGLRIHGFGVKSGGFGMYADYLTSADSLAWSYGARREARGGKHPSCGRKSCANCLHYALEWRDKVLRSLDTRQMTLPLYA